ncbi:PKD domain protein [Roseovarius tolerans]|uniref:PKD domain protein n=1 Tax=Roseovarius tolerans TaxID=74031 RepID=A0A0L6CQM9_9RHOB|nr:right-handed parallel beta-helix repeat-containing protein [Roseovarius tolerans]KNX40057.1 PKD domain protein [Roseovarius tolerans]
MSKIFSVSNSEELMNALASATGGDTIELAGADYGNLNLNHQTDFDFTYDSPVTIVSSNADSPASFSSMSMVGASNIVFDSIQFDYTYQTTDALWHKPFSISDSNNITIKNSVFDGDVASETGTFSDGYGTGFGLTVWSSSDVTVDNTEFKSWWKGAAFSRSTDLTITNNDIHDIRSDGVNFSEVQSVLFEGNHIHDFRVSKESGDHADMIQVISTTHAETTTADLTIRGNILDIGEGDVTQMIFMANGKYDLTKDNAWLYQDITIEDNLIQGSHIHGISVGATDGVTIRNNTMLDAKHPDGAAAPVIRTNQSINVLIEDNAVPGIANADSPDPTWTIQNNLILQTVSSGLPGYDDDQFITSSTTGGVGAFILDPDGELATSGVGVTWMGLDASPDTLAPQFDVHSKGTDSQTLVFDASHTYGPSGAITADDAKFYWTFGDGTKATGQIVEHKFGAAGIYDVTLEVALKDGTTGTAASNARVIGGDVLTFNSDDGTFYLQSYGEEEAIAGTDVASARGDSGGMTVDLSASESLTEIRANNLNNFLGSKSFDLSMSFEADQPGISQGWLLHHHSVLTVKMDKFGDILVSLWNDAGTTFNLKSAGLNLNDGGVHSFEIHLDDESDTIQLLVDGALRDSTEFSGELSQGINHSLKFGSPWGGSFDGQMHSFDLDITASDYSVYEGTTPLTSEEGKPDAPVVEEEGQSDNSVEAAPDSSNSPTETPESETTPDEGSDTTAPESSPDKDASAPLWKLDGFEIFEHLEKPNQTVKFGDDAHVADLLDQSTLILDGDKDHIKLGRIEEYETSDKITVDLEFQRGDADGHDILFWNHGRLGVSMNGDMLEVRVGQVDNPFHSGFRIMNSGLNDEDTHSLRIVADGESDRLQIIVDNEIVLDDSSRDLDLIQADLGQWGYMIGTPWASTFDGAVTGLEIDDSAQFIPEDPMLSV